jgi:hypothetical protein
LETNFSKVYFGFFYFFPFGKILILFRFTKPQSYLFHIIHQDTGQFRCPNKSIPAQ